MTGTVTASDVVGAGNPVTIDVQSVVVEVFVPKINVSKTIVSVSRPGDPAYVYPTSGDAAPGDTVLYQVVVTNPAGSGIQLNHLIVNDSMLGRRPNPPGADILDPGEQVLYQYQYIIKTTDRSPLANIVTATATGIEVATSVSASSAVTIPLVTSQLEVELTYTPDLPRPPERGDTITFHALIKNVGTTSIQDLAFVPLDPPTLSNGPLPTIIPTLIWPGDANAIEMTWKYTIPTDPNGADPLATRVRVAGRSTADNHIVVAEDQVIVDIVNPNLNVSVTVVRPASGAILRGADAEFQVTVHNTSLANLCHVVVKEILRDPDLGTETVIVPNVSLAWPNPASPGNLGPDESASGSTTYQVTGQNKDPLQIIFEATADSDCLATPTEPPPLKDRGAATIDISDAQVNAELTADVGADGFVSVNDPPVDFTLNLFNVGALALKISRRPIRYMARLPMIT